MELLPTMKWTVLRRQVAVALGSFAVPILLASCASAEFTPNCKEMPDQPKASSIDELIEQAEFVGLYTVNKASEAGFAGKTDSPFRVEVFDFELVLSTAVSTTAPRKISLRGTKPDQRIPEAYFFIKERHQELVENDALLLGLAYQIETADGVCQYVPELMVGYSYLIFSGANSGAAFEPILSTRYDPFYQEVMRRMRDRK